MAVVAENLLKSGEVSAMIRQGFISSPRLSPASSPPPKLPATASGSSEASAFPSPLRPSFPAPRTTTLFEMMAQEGAPLRPPMRTQQHDLQERIAAVLASKGPSDLKLSVSSSNGMRIRMAAHRRVLTARSRFFAEKLAGICGRTSSRPVVVEICECDDAEVYVEAVGLMYSDDLRRMLAGEDVEKVLGLLQVSVDIKFDEGISACLDYLEAIPWSEYEEEKVTSIIGKLHIQQLSEPVREILQRVSVEPSSFANADSIFLGIFDGILQSKDKKARRDMKTLISSLLKEDVNHSNAQYNKLDVSKESLYYLCHKCLDHLMQLFSEAANVECLGDRASLMNEVAREADNVQWLVDILINKRIADEFVVLWGDQRELSTCHSKIPCMYRFEISRITAQLFVALGRGQILVSKDAKISLLRTWLEALYDDFGWMKRACREFDKKMVEDGLCATILTLPMVEQQSILLRWSDCFLSNGDNCPNMQRAFEVWWRRAFVRQYTGDPNNSQLQNVVSDDHT
ncbi:BTB/POZ domain-containing protein At5g60050-like [Zingiber officinale]|uniref:BTB/POZ domain-containing protein At5g60050-like n=1 Tax=Zingiber officinale TaxID=94328 RepID=UPI001C4CBFE5|nr:BTB/POZ domain-containing protein At5g60050-like [Zingiber officinale]